MNEKFEDILKYWYYLERFQPHALEAKNYYVIDKNTKKGEKQCFLKNDSAEKKQHIIYIGKISIDKLVDNINEKLNSEQNVEKLSGDICLCGIVCNDNGEYIEKSFVINPFFFASAMILKEASVDVDITDAAMDKINDYMNTYILENIIQVSNKLALEVIISTIIKEFSYKYETDCFALIKSIEIKQNSDLSSDNEIQMEIVNSFFTHDIMKILAEKMPDNNLSKYVEVFCRDNNDKKKIDSDISELKKWLEPNRFPMGKWPSKYSPSLMQQIAINIAISDKDRRESMFSVNGPPGTGKTTLLKEIIASTIVSKAKILVTMDPNTAFEKKIIDPCPEANTDLKEYYEIPIVLRDLGIIVASNGNTAVENITLELPKASDVFSDHTYTDMFDINKHEEIYFSKMATQLLGENKVAWGLMSASLGKKSNIFNLKKLINPKYKSTPMYKYFEKPECSWEDEKIKFNNAWNKVIEYRKQIEKDVQLLEELSKLSQSISEIEKKIVKNESQLDQLDIYIKEKNNIFRKVESEFIIEKNKLDSLERGLSIWSYIIYSILVYVFFWRGKRTVEIRKLRKKVFFLKDELEKIRKQIDKINVQNAHIRKIIKMEKSNLLTIGSEYKEVHKRVYTNNDALKRKYKNNFADEEYFINITDNEISQSSCPWTTEEYDKLREELFYRALQLQKSFITHSVGMKTNLLMLYNFWNGAKFSCKEKERICPHLFAALSLLIPVISTTFASVGSFLKYIGRNEMGILIIDEAGQATPQAALGLIWRTKKAIVVGDPLQVEPIFNIPQAIINIFGKRYQVPDQYRNGELSVQGMADKLNEFTGEINSKEVGCPLVIHRRCLDPMFSISNTISYGGRMFNKTVNIKNLENRFLLEKSVWLDIKGTELGNKNHFVEKQGVEVLKLFDNAVVKYGKEFLCVGQKRLYIISPFKSVVYEINKIILDKYKNNEFFSEMSEKEKKAWFKESVGTIHSFQGKEADEVIFVLGCDQYRGYRAAKWAGNKANILNVAVTRAKYRIAIIGDKGLWEKISPFDTALKMIK